MCARAAAAAAAVVGAARREAAAAQRAVVQPGRMETPGGAALPKLTQEAPKVEGQAPITISMHGLIEESRSSPAEEEGGTPIPTSGLLQVAERRQPLSSVSSLEVHFDLLDLTELTDMSDQELAEVFADSDEENLAREPSTGLHPHPTPRAGYLCSPSWTRTKTEPGREKKHLSDSELQADTFLAVEKPKTE